MIYFLVIINSKFCIYLLVNCLGVSDLDLEMNGRRIIFLEARKKGDVDKYIEEKNERNSISLEKVKSLD